MFAMETTYMEIDDISAPEHATNLIFSPTPRFFIPVEHDYEVMKIPQVFFYPERQNLTIYYIVAIYIRVVDTP